MRIDTNINPAPEKRKEKSDMAKPILKFTAVPYGIGEFKGYRPQLEAQNPVSDLDFCREVVTEKRLAMSRRRARGTTAAGPSSAPSSSPMSRRPSTRRS